MIIFMISVCGLMGLLFLIIVYGIIEMHFRKYDEPTKSWYYGSLENHRKKFLKKNPHMRDYFYYLYNGKEWYKEMTRNF